MADLPEAVIAHVSEGRVRLKVAAKKHDADFFARLEQQLAPLPGIERVQVNPLTGSVLVCHSLHMTSSEDVDSLAAAADMAGLFTLAPHRSDNAAPAAAPIAQSVAARLDRMNDHIKATTGGFIDVPTLAIAGLVVLGIRQMRQGVVFIPAITALWYASSLLKDQLPKDRGGNSR